MNENILFKAFYEGCEIIETNENCENPYLIMAEMKFILLSLKQLGFDISIMVDDYNQLIEKYF